MIQNQSPVFLEMGKELSSCTAYSELVYRFSKARGAVDLDGQKKIQATC